MPGGREVARRRRRGRAPAACPGRRRRGRRSARRRRSSGGGSPSPPPRTPGIAAVAARSRSYSATSRSGVAYRVASGDTRSTTSCSIGKPASRARSASEAATEEPGADEQHERERDLRDRHAVAEPACAGAAGDGARPLAQRRRACAAQRARSAGAIPNTSAVASDTASANASTRAVDVHARRGAAPRCASAMSGASAAQPGDAGRRRAARRARPPASATTRLSASSCRSDARRAGAERDAHGELALARDRAHEREVRDVGARDEQQQPDGAEQHEHRPAHTSPTMLLTQRHEVRAPAAVRRRRARSASRARRRREIRLRGGDRRAPGARRAIDARVDAQVAPREPLRDGRAHGRERRERRPRLRPTPGVLVARRHHADDGVAPLRELQRPPDDGGSPPKRVRHSRWPSTMTGGAPARSSSARNVRPRAARAPQRRGRSPPSRTRR